MQVSVKRPSFIKQEMGQPTAEKIGLEGIASGSCRLQG